MPIVDVEVFGPQSGGAPLDRAAEDIVAAAGRALDATGGVFFGGAPDPRQR